MDSSTESEGPVLSVQERGDEMAVKAGNKRGKSKGPIKKRKVDKIEEDPEERERTKKFNEEFRRREKEEKQLRQEFHEAGIKLFQPYQNRVDDAPNISHPEEFSEDQQLRDALFDKYNGNRQEATCPVCNIAVISRAKSKYSSTPSFHAGHIFPKSKGGTNNFNNVIPICAGCNHRCKTKHLYFFAWESCHVDLPAWIKRVEETIL